MHASLAFLISALPLMVIMSAGATPNNPDHQQVPIVLRVSVEGPIHPVTAEIIGDAVQQARQQNAGLILIRLNTPGGLLEDTRRAVQDMIASPVPVAVFVTPSGARAASAGFFLLEAADIAAMSPGTNTGAASPILLGQTMDPVLRKKAENDISALLRSISSKRGRNSELAEAAGREAKALTEAEALKDRLIDIEAKDEIQLLTQLNGMQVRRFDGETETLHLAQAKVIDFQASWREKIFQTIADPNIGFILLILGVLGIYVEITSPGVFLPGVLGSISAVLGLASLAVLPINWAGAALLVLAITFFGLEFKFTTHGVLGVGGAIAMVLGAVTLVNGPPEMRIHWTTAFSVVLPFAILALFLTTLAVKAKRSRVLTGAAALIGEVGVTRTPLKPHGEVLIHGEYWEATTSGEIEEGSLVRVSRVDGMLLLVDPEPVSHPPAQPAAKG